MNRDKWEEVLMNIENNFEVFNRDIEVDNETTTEWIEFNGPAGKMRLEWIEKPKVLGVKTLYTKRAGVAERVDQAVSNKEKVNFLRAYKWEEEDEDWIKMDYKV